MSIRLNPYLNFHGNASEALAFYHSVLGGTLAIMHYDSIPGVMGDEHEGAKVMHGQIDTDDGLTLMAADIPDSMAGAPDATVSGISVCISGDAAERISALWEGLAEGGEISQPFETAPWGDTFGMLNDRFGVPWMVSLATPPQA
ncbi:VOC family protein [Leucobacter massiliensis]|uniref:Bleomycin resistance protein n=1 Tax=Leucobacter massiliensis TaxID=1686285 RepID=A0A2S9QMK6_9MICO|nr:VOC family protein [Leucobacter massiliensis]PRI10797.1 bleomycin resistance protein [Leucobacter massiliensis]